jgi:hypothetical protein
MSGSLSYNACGKGINVGEGYAMGGEMNFMTSEASILQIVCMCIFQFVNYLQKPVQSNGSKKET